MKDLSPFEVFRVEVSVLAHSKRATAWSLDTNASLLLEWLSSEFDGKEGILDAVPQKNYFVHSKKEKRKEKEDLT